MMWRAAWCLLLASLGGCGGPSHSQGDGSPPPTFARDIAPVVFDQCAGCHREGGSGPFSLVTYDEVRNRGADIVQATGNHYMPPWLPAASDVSLTGERGLTNQQIETIGSWVEGGAPEGDPLETPPPPQWAEGWQLGEPDLILNLPEEFLLPAEGTDVFRNFVLPIPVGEPRYVRAVEIQPGNPQAVHHAFMTVDRHGSCHRLDTQDPRQGFEGMSMGLSESPEGHMLGWTPGKNPHSGYADMAWRVEKGMDLVLQLHMRPTGKPERIRPRVGIFFAARPPTKFPHGLILQTPDIDIPAGAQHHVREQSFRIPVDVDVLSIYPHAHYVCSQVEVFVQLPTGDQVTLIDIPAWDFNWQDQYHLKAPMFLPAGTVLTMWFTFDNSANNVRNPNHPPKRVMAGERTTDEMANLWMQLLPRNPQELDVLREALLRHALAISRGPEQLFNLATELQRQGHNAEALPLFQQAVVLDPDFSRTHHNLAGALAASGQLDAAIAAMRRAIELDPDIASAHCNLGSFWFLKRDLPRAMACYRKTLELDPGHAQARKNLTAIEQWSKERGRNDE